MDIMRLTPAFKDYLWGGNKLKERYGKRTDLTPCAESWELSFHPDGPSRLTDSRTLAEAVTPRDLGTNVADFPFFPVLNKFIDAEGNLSVQVHPSDAYALREENSFGKTEMWYIVEAAEGAGIYLGLNRDVTRAEFESAIQNETLTELLNFYPVKAGECYFIPAGTIHAIAKGCLIYEIQQNSNLTYRVYDYGRRGKDGKPRELHVDKALAVTTLSKFEPITMAGDLLGVSKYFTVRRVTVKGAQTDCVGTGSYRCLTCVKGAGKLNHETVQVGDSFFLPAGFGSYTLDGEMEMIMTETRKYYIGIDLGGTFIKGGIVDDEGKIIIKDKVPTESDKGAAAVIGNIVGLCNSLLARVGMTTADVQGVGMGVPGMIDSETGVVIYANNLGWEDLSVCGPVGEALGLPVKLTNDANAAALGETKFGGGKNRKSSVMLTLGTGVGGGVIIDGKIFEGNRSAGTELGHEVIVAGGEPCTCGRRGCLEAYTSATALIRETKRAMEAHPESAMWEVGSLDAVDGKTAFTYKDTDPAAAAVVASYIEKLGVGITNYANTFRPEVMILGGGVCAEGDRLILPLREFLSREIYAGSRGPAVELVTASLGNDAGLLGAAALLM